MIIVNQYNPIGNNLITPAENRNRFVFNMFCLWTFFLLCRPQDIFPILNLFRPVLVIGILSIGLVVLRYKELSGPPFFQERQVKYYTSLLLIMILGIPLSLYPRYSFILIFQYHINVIMFFYIFYKLIDSVDKLSRVLFLCCLGNGLYSAFSITKGVLGWGRLSFGNMFDANDLAYFTLGFLPLNLIFMSRDNPLWVRLSCLGCFGVGIMLILQTGSRGGLLGFAVTTSLLLFLTTKTVRLSLKAVIVALCLVIVTLSTINVERYKTLLTINNDYNMQDETGRITIWKIGVKAMLANPFTGVGFGCFSNAVGNDRVARGADSFKWQTAHNSLVQIGTETGVIGLALFSLLSFNVLSIFRRVKNVAVSDTLVRICEMAFVGFAGMFTSSMFLSQAYSIYWAFYVVFSSVVNQLLVKKQAFDAGQV